MVRLKVSVCPPLFTEEMSFNSNMVRLKVVLLNGTKGAIKLFQFQYGSIKSLCQDIAVLLFFAFQFQYGSIKRFFQSVKE